MYQDKPPIQSYFGVQEDEDYIVHYGMPRRSGRYPWGSGEDPYQHEDWSDFLVRVNKLKASGWTETPENIKKEFGDNMTTTQYRREKSYAEYKDRCYRVNTAKRLKEKGNEENGWQPMGASEIGRVMGINESSVRSLLNDKSESRMMKAQHTADFLKEELKEKRMIDVGPGVERELNIPRNKLDTALFILQKEGYHVYKGGIPQATNPGQQSNQSVLCAPDVEHKEIYNFDQIKTITDYKSLDNGQSFDKRPAVGAPVSLDSKRLMIRYKEDGGIDKDGTIELRRGVKDLALTDPADATGTKGEKTYAQVRILVDGTHYLKGMAVYNDGKDMPDGVDVIFNTNKGKDKPMTEVLKKIKEDPDNPFGSLIKGQNHYVDKDGNQKQGLINYRAVEGDWDDWKNAVPSQFLAKQSIHMAEKQLNLAKETKAQEYADIMALTNPTVKKYLLNKFASECDSSAVHLQAAALPGQRYQVLTAIPTMKETEVYAPNFQDGTKLALVRYPHGGIFEIPVLTVNNRQKQARSILGTKPQDAIGINSKVAEQLSGADFDGDTVMCIPTDDKQGKVRISRSKPLEGLKGFDPKDSYQYDTVKTDAKGESHYYRNGREFPVMKNTQTEMGIISNLITDMTIGNAKPDELARAVRHSMVVIDAEKHKLDYKQSYVDNNIDGLKKEYQSGGGASTILSKAKGQYSIPKTQGTPRVNMKGKEYYDPSKPEGALIYKKADDLYYPIRKKDANTGNIILRTVDGGKVSYNPNDPAQREKYEPVRNVTLKNGKKVFGETITNKDGSIVYKTKTRMERTTKMAATNDPYTLVSKAQHPMELLYARHAASMKSMANEARKSMMTAGSIKYNKEAAKAYAPEVASLNAKLNVALLNATKERQAQRLTQAELNRKKAEGLIDKSDVKKTSQKTIEKYRKELGTSTRSERNISITAKEWEAIQAGAISENTLHKILSNADIDVLRDLATPKSQKTLSNTKIARIKALSNSNYTTAQIAEMMGVSTSTITKYLKGA